MARHRHRPFDGDELPVWHEATGNYLDPATGEVLPTWDQALDAIGAEDEPLHVARFGDRFDAQGVLAGSKDAGRCIGYLTKYLTKQVADCHQADTDAQQAHADRLAEALRYEPCSPRCANWLRYGIQPKNARPGLLPGACKGKAHPPSTSATPGAASWSPASGPARRWPTTAPTARTGCWPRSGFRQPTRPATPGNPSPPPTRTTWNTPGGCCTSSPTAPDGKPRSPKPDAGQRSDETRRSFGNGEGSMTAEQSELPSGGNLLDGDWLSTEELAKLLGVDPSTIRRWRTARPTQGPPFLRLSSRVTVYSTSDVRRWLERRRTDPERAA